MALHGKRITPRTRSVGRKSSPYHLFYIAKFDIQEIDLDEKLLRRKIKQKNLDKKVTLTRTKDGLIWHYKGKPPILIRQDGLYAVKGKYDKRYLENQAFIVASFLYSCGMLKGERKFEKPKKT